MNLKTVCVLAALACGMPAFGSPEMPHTVVIGVGGGTKSIDYRWESDRGAVLGFGIAREGRKDFNVIEPGKQPRSAGSRSDSASLHVGARIGMVMAGVSLRSSLVAETCDLGQVESEDADIWCEKKDAVEPATRYKYEAEHDVDVGFFLSVRTKGRFSVGIRWFDNDAKSLTFGVRF